MKKESHGRGPGPEREHDELYFSDRAEYGMTPSTVLAQYIGFIDRYCPLKGRRVLDFGCGNAPTAGEIRRLGAEYVGLEPSAPARDSLVARGVRVGASLEDVAGQGPYDVVTAFEVIEHLPEPGPVVQGIHDVLNPGGYFFVTTPNAGSAKARLLGARWAQAENPTHLALYTPSAVQRLFRNHGFDVVARQRHVEFPSGASALRRISERALQQLALDGGLRVLGRVPS